MHIERVLCAVEHQEVVMSVAPLGSVEESPTICGLCRTRYEERELSECKAKREQAKRIVQQGLRRERRQRNRLVKDVQERLAKQNGDSRGAGILSGGANLWKGQGVY